MATGTCLLGIPDRTGRLISVRLSKESASTWMEELPKRRLLFDGADNLPLLQ